MPDTQEILKNHLTAAIILEGRIEEADGATNVVDLYAHEE